MNFRIDRATLETNSTSIPVLPVLGAVLDAVAAEVVVMDRTGRILAVNAPWDRFSRDNGPQAGVPAPNTLVGANYFAVCQVAPGEADAPQAAAAREGLQAVLDGELPEFSMDYPCDSPTRQRWFTMVVHPLGEGACDGLVITHVDVTRLKLAEAKAQQGLEERHQIELQLAEHQHRLEELVEQRTAELSRALESARAADQAKNQFLANVTHELRTPLCAVLGFADLARPLSPQGQQREYLDKLISAGKTLAETIDDLLDLSKIVAGSMKFEAKPFGIRSLVARCHSVISYRADKKGLSLVQVVSNEVPPVLVGDSLRIEQILLNLLSNAVKFTERGEVRLDIGVLASESARVRLRLSVSDTGIGLREDEIPLLFKPFSQADSSITRRFGGTGLGLAICDHLARQMDGEIRVHSRLGVGTRFEVDLWVDRDPEAIIPLEAQRQPDRRRIRYRNTRALIVDDQPFNRDLVAALLTSVGIIPRIAAHGQAAIDQLVTADEEFDLVLMDIQMPVMDGLTATRELRSMPRFALLPIIAMTAHTMTHERERGAQAGMTDHVGKPFNEQVFFSVLARWISPDKQDSEDAAAMPEMAAGLEAPMPLLPEIAGIDPRESLRLMQGDVRRYTHWLLEFLDSGPETVTQIRAALAGDDRAEASMAVHRLKGRAGFLGMDEVQSLAKALEDAIDAGDACDLLVDELALSVEALCIAIVEAVPGGC